MGKAKKSNLAPAKHVALVKQLTEGKVAKTRNKDKFNLRAQEGSVEIFKVPKKLQK